MKPRFNLPKLRATFYAWHGGQSSALYAAASSGLVENVNELRDELDDAAQSMWKDKSNFKQFNYVDGSPTQSSMRAPVYADWLYLRRVMEALPDLLSLPFTHPRDGRAYRALPWANLS